MAYILKRNTVLAFFLVVAISQIFPLWFANLLKKINLQICMLKINVFNLHQTYQERRRDGPFDVLATQKRVPNPTPKRWRKMSEIHKISPIFFVKSYKNYETKNRTYLKTEDSYS